MRSCPYCAETNQDAAVVCRRCQREFTDSGGSGIEKIRPAAPSAKKRLYFGFLMVILLVGGIALALNLPEIIETLAVGAPRSSTAPLAPATPEDEPCRVEAPASARAAAQKWCEDGVFTLVRVNMDANNVIVLLTLSRKSAANFAANKFAVLNQFRGLADEMAKASDMNVAFSIHEPEGRMVGGCARERSATESICR